MSLIKKNGKLSTDTPMAIWLETDSVNCFSDGCFVVGGNKPEDLIEPDEVIEGDFKEITFGEVRIPFIKTNPTQREMAVAINDFYTAQVAAGNEFPFGDHIFIEEVTAEDGVIAFRCGS